jgi:hypothetical protein
MIVVEVVNVLVSVIVDMRRPVEPGASGVVSAVVGKVFD